MSFNPKIKISLAISAASRSFYPSIFALMSLFITSLNSGSNGNCYYVGNNQDAILVDAGLSCREIEKRMARLDLSMDRVKALFISHEHTDHIKGVEKLANKHNLPVYISSGTYNNCKIPFIKKRIVDFKEEQPITIGSLKVEAFSKLHDAADPYSFMISDGDINVGVFTDIGFPCEKLLHYFRLCHAAFLEANYDEDMLDKGNYPFYLKHRIRGGKGHLSNSQALNVFKQHRSSHLSHLLLAHLSKNNNCPNLVKDLFERHAEGIKITIASRFEETPVFAVTGIREAAVPPHYRTSPATQLGFAFA